VGNKKLSNRVIRNVRDRLPILCRRSDIEAATDGLLRKQTLSNMAHDGRGPKFTRIGRRVVYARDDVVDWLEEHAECVGE